MHNDSKQKTPQKFFFLAAQPKNVVTRTRRSYSCNATEHRANGAVLGSGGITCHAHNHISPPAPSFVLSQYDERYEKHDVIT